MKYRFTFSSEDGNGVKDFDNLRDAEKYMNDFIEGTERWTQTTFWPYDSHTSFRLFKDRKGRVIKIDKIESRKCVRCGNEFRVESTTPDQTHCTQICWQLDNSNRFRPGQTIDIESCIKKDSIDAITKDIYELAQIEYSHSNALTHAEIIFVDDNGNQYEYDGVCINEGKLKVSIRSNKPAPLPLPRVQRKYFNFENEITVDLLPFNQDTLEKIRLERECMEKDVEGSIMNRSQIWHYLSNGFTITTYQADYVIENENFSYDEITKTK